jgi:hypothetical protein
MKTKKTKKKQKKNKKNEKNKNKTKNKGKQRKGKKLQCVLYANNAHNVRGYSNNEIYVFIY